MFGDLSVLLLILLGTIGLLPIVGPISLWVGRSSEPRAVRTGQRSVTALCVLGFAASLVGLVSGESVTLTLPWRLPVGAFSVGLDPLSAFFLLPLFLLSGLAAIYAGGYFTDWSERKPGTFWAHYTVLVASMALVFLARNGVLFLMAWELMSLSSFFLVVFDDKDPKVRNAGWIYLVATHFGTALLIALFAVLGSQSGSQDFVTWAAPTGLAGVAFLLALLGFGTKAGLFPLHVWLPEAHPAAPSPVSALMSGVMIKTGIYGIVRMLIILDPLPAWCSWVMLGMGVLSGIAGILFSLAQQDLKRLLAYSSVENIGIIALGLGVGMMGLQHDSPTVAVLGFTGALLHVLNHALFKGLLFLAAGAIARATGILDVEQLGGLLKRMPRTGMAFLIGATSICALPPFNGFASEFLIYLGAFMTVRLDGSIALGGVLALACLAVIGGLAVASFAKAFGIVFQGEPRSPMASTAKEPPTAMTTPMLVMAASCLLLGLGAVWLVFLLEPAIAQLTGPFPMLSVPRWLYPTSLFAVFAGLIISVALLAWARHRLLEGRTVRKSVTWDCGYAQPTVRMQYTGAGFVQPLTTGAETVLFPQTKMRQPQGLFPTSSFFESTVPDVARSKVFDPLFRWSARGLGWFRWLQQGRVHLYVLYVVVTLSALLVWAFWS